MVRSIVELTRKPGRRAWPLLGAGLALIAVVAMLSRLQTVDEGEVCTVTTWGKVSGDAGPGLHSRGLGKKFHCFSTRRTTYEAGKTVNADYTDGVVKGPTSDGQEVQLSYRIGFLVKKESAEMVYRDVARNMDEVDVRVVEFYSRPKVRQIAQEYSAAQLYGGEAVTEGQDPAQAHPARVKLVEIEARMFETLQPLFAEKGVTLVDFQLGKPEFAPEYVDAIQKRQLAEENVRTQKNNALAARQEADRTANLADGQARANVALANAEATSIAVRGAASANADANAISAKGAASADAEATAIAVKGAAIRENPEVLRLEMIQAISHANVIYLPSGTVTQFLDVGPASTPKP